MNGLLVETTPDNELSVVPIFPGQHRLVVSSDRLNDPTSCWVRDCDTGTEIPAERTFTILFQYWTPTTVAGGLLFHHRHNTDPNKKRILKTVVPNKRIRNNNILTTLFQFNVCFLFFFSGNPLFRSTLPRCFLFCFLVLGEAMYQYQQQEQ